MEYHYLSPFDNEKTRKSLKELESIAVDMKCKLHQLALAWAIRYKYLDSALIGVRNLIQLEDALTSLEFIPQITNEIEKKINKILDNNPQQRMNFISGKPFSSVR
jgi:aryl-alcohol dehydrogenase-like predicted oxidoreductase